ncbi:MAG TPA: phosphoribosylglycinamide formyltransferase [Bacillota bacterium]|jgi:phosphoribosylglycinamide formyltransferase-1
MVALGVLASGRGTNLQAIIDAVKAGRLDARLAVVISDKPGAAAIERARRHGAPAVVVDRRAYGGRAEHERAVVETLRAHHVDLVCLAGYMRIVGPTLLDAFGGRVMNIHPALLPAFPGVDAQKQALEHGVKVTGCTVHFVDKGMDSGPIILQRAVPVLEGDDVETLAARILEQEHQAYPEAIRLYAAGRLEVIGRRVRILGEEATSCQDVR